MSAAALVDFPGVGVIADPAAAGGGPSRCAACRRHRCGHSDLEYQGVVPAIHAAADTARMPARATGKAGQLSGGGRAWREAPASPPVRYEVGQPGYDHELGRRIEVLLDGAVVPMVIGYDCVAGTVSHFVSDGEGRRQFNPARTEALRETLTGRVTARWRA